jgi:hypothetical protein
MGTSRAVKLCRVRSSTHIIHHIALLCGRKVWVLGQSARCKRITGRPSQDVHPACRWPLALWGLRRGLGPGCFGVN